MKHIYKDIVLPNILPIIVVVFFAGAIYLYSTNTTKVQSPDPIATQEPLVTDTPSESTQPTPTTPSADSVAPAPQNDAVAIENSFNGYRTAILNENGNEALKFISNNTIAYYADLLASIKTESKAQVQSRRLIDRFSILAMRARFSNEVMNINDGTSLVAFAINKGMIGSQSVSNIKFNSADISGNVAYVTVTSNNTISPIKFRMVREDGAWKIDLAETIINSNTAFVYLIKDSGYTEDEFIFMMIESTGGIRPTEKVWEPLSK